MNQFICASFFVLFAFLFLPGCSSSSPFPVQSVEGVVTLDGEPVADAVVGFSPASGSEGKPAFARTDANGSFRLTTVQGGAFGEGAPEGNYEVSVTKEVPEREITQKEMEEMDRTGRSPNIAILSVVPKKYNDTKKSGLTATIVKGKNKIDLPLKSGK
ncbi:MAG: hypothetical protein ACRCUY_08015 [Thermoguttaceae bacterium]